MTGNEYLDAFYKDGQTASLIQCLWCITQPTIEELRYLLKDASGSDLEDDFDEYIDVDVMTKTGLSYLGFTKPQECNRIFDAHSGKLSVLLEKLAEQCDLNKISKEHQEEYNNNAEKRVPMPMLLAEAAVYLLRSHDELKEWCRRFLKIVNYHPEPYKVIQDVLCNTMQGGLLIVNHYQSSHRTYDEAENCFMSFMTHDRLDSEEILWKGKRDRMVRALEGK